MRSSCPVPRGTLKLCGSEEGGHLCSSAGRHSLSCSTSEPPKERTSTKSQLEHQQFGISWLFLCRNEKGQMSGWSD